MKFFVYKASAGSGKTYTLVKEYLKMALVSGEPSGFKSILALTFTNKAAAEMKERVIRVLHSIVQTNEEIKEADRSLLHDLTLELNLKEEEIRKRAKRTLTAILHNYSDFSIGTIDSFMHRVVKTFAHDLHLPINFSVEMDQTVLLQQAIDQVMDLVGKDQAITTALVGFTEFRTEEEKNMSVQEELFSTAKDLLQEQKFPFIQRLKHLNIEDFIRIRKEIQASTANFELKMQAFGKEAVSMISQSGVQPASFYYGAKGIPGWFNKLKDYGNGQLLPLNSYQEKTIYNDQWYSGSVDFSQSNSIDSIKPKLLEIAHQALQLEKNEGAQYVINSQLKNSLFTVGLLNEISKILDKIRDEEFIVHISEFNKRVAEIVFNEPVPFIFERLGERYQHFLIDEFQDTSVLQWQNLLPLIQNGLAENAASLIVGDGKQAIYRFRGGEVEQFAQLPKPYPADLASLQKERYTLLEALFDGQTLKKNFRSLPEIIGFNNRLYSHLKESILPEGFKTVYDDHFQESPSQSNEGYIRLETIRDHSNRQERDEKQLERVQRIVKELTEQKGYQYSDIAILTRRNSEGTMIAGNLLRSGIPVISNESLLLSSSQEVRFLVAWLRILIGENAEVNFLQICAYLVDHQKLPFDLLDTLIRRVSMRELPVLNLLAENGIQISLFELRSLSLFEACNKICQVFNFDIHENPYLQFFLEAVWNVGKQQSSDIPQFLEFWEEKKMTLSISLPQGANAVRIMTVHRSKGLQFPVVILPFAYSERPKATGQWVDDEKGLPQGLPAARLALSKKLENTDFFELVEIENDRTTLDALNLLYVATTRPEDALYIITGRSGVKDSIVKGWEQYLESFSLVENPTSFNEGVVEWGDPQFKNVRKKNDTGQITSSVLPYETGRWQERITITRMASRLWDVDGEDSAISNGKLMHLALSWVANPSDIDAAVARLSEEGFADERSCKEVKADLIRLVNHPQLKEWFEVGQRIRNERSLLLPDGNVLRPDRVIERNNTAVIIDYKTGLPRKEHQVQVAQYIRQLRQLPYSSVRGMLVYLGKEIGVEEVTI